MSMICYVLGLSPAQIKALQTTPSLAGDVVQVKLDERSRMSPAAYTRWRRMIEQSPGKEALEQVDAARPQVDRIGPFEELLNLKKTWHILHYLFTGHLDKSKAPGDALLSGQELGDDEMGYGPARLHDEQETAEFSRFLNALEVEQLQAQAKYPRWHASERPPGVYGVYPDPSGRGSDAEHKRALRAIVATYFPLLRDYTARMAEKQYGLLVWLS
jgi:Domain of unknown function (DUF1877)